MTLPTPSRIRELFGGLETPDPAAESGWALRGTLVEHDDADLFWVHPTTERSAWFGDAAVPDAQIAVDRVVRSQVAAFGGRVWAPRYRQAGVAAFHARAELGELPYELAYDDVAAAFVEYLAVSSGSGRPLVLGGHSQGARHVRALLGEFADNQEVTQRLVAAYLIGIDVPVDAPTAVAFAAAPDQTGVAVICQARLGDPGAASADCSPDALVCVEPKVLGLADTDGVVRSGHHLLLSAVRIGALADQALADGSLHPVEVEALAPVLGADARRRTEAWRGLRDESTQAWRRAGAGAPARVEVSERREVEVGKRREAVSSGDPEPVVLLHKLGGWAAEWQAMIDALGGGRRVLALDLPGHGSAHELPAPFLQRPADSARAVLDLLDAEGIGACHLVGASLGGVVAAHLATFAPDRVTTLTLAGAALGEAWTSRRLLEGERAARSRFGPGWMPLPGGSSRAGAAPAHVLADLDASRAAAGAWVRSSERGVAIGGVAHLLPLIVAPTLVLNGADGPYRRFEDVALDALRDLRVVVVDGAGAFAHQERPDAVAAHWRDFVAAVGHSRRR
ncbi:alpha/beta fold hydrolase [Nocardioides dubius]|uniref:AB hydrolase-1 domain-containing protein n=1 Tax=Nocardioides dubius TaxID=317019 RepID=A0ABN1TNX0_9ACTN